MQLFSLFNRRALIGLVIFGDGSRPPLDASTPLPAYGMAPRSLTLPMNQNQLSWALLIPVESYFREYEVYLILFPLTIIHLPE